MPEMIILVDENDNQIGTGEKMAVHRAGDLHRCFSIFVFSSSGQVLLQKRAARKYHSGGLWTNTCCSHPRDGEELSQAIHRRLVEEMGFDCDLKEVFSFIYRAELDHGLIEHEFDHVFVGIYDGPIRPNPEEADGYEWRSVPVVAQDMRKNPHQYTVWSIIAFEKLLEKAPHLRKGTSQ
ncbi:MAG: isopentenyl-diphosphate Delta-isomerase [Myxococcota bacterium]|nr:isopentenyl-diphosphate Delta-isomerase [Myxococcota bacterium]